MPVSTAEVLMDLLEDQENAIQTIAVHLYVGPDLFPLQFEAMFQLKRRIEETRECLETMIQGTGISDSFAEAA